MRSKETPAILTAVVFVLIVFLVVKLLGALVGFVLKVVLLLAAVGVAALIYRAVKNKLGGPGAT